MFRYECFKHECLKPPLTINKGHLMLKTVGFVVTDATMSDHRMRKSGCEIWVLLQRL